ncbi:MAG: tRNA 4-thiouridine(8) synthase ThiI [Ruminococcaceae bacterium]|nr:tRNA 4-thiouridine(8) synthase ThiI [Oscillospiraceae bacterium]
MKEIILVKYGEIILKGLNRPVFENILLKNIREALKSLGEIEVTRAQAAIFIDPSESVDIDDVIERLKKVIGVLSITRAGVCEKNIDAIKKAALEYCGEDILEEKTFKVEAKRADKKFPLKSPEICREVGGYLFHNLDGAQVDVNNPSNVVMVEIRDFGAYVYCKKIAGQGGLPIGTGGRAMLLLSGGIDSPVAGYMIAKRGVELEAINFFSYPYTSERAKEKVISLAKILSGYVPKIKLHIVPFTEIQLAIRDNCPEDHLTLIMRRFMMKISERVARANGAEALITGESLGQVASQTMQALHVTNSVVDMPVFRPLIGMDKEEIVRISRKIGAFETSILPYEDCCTVFTPKHPVTKPKVEKIIASESVLEIEELIQKAIDGVETIVIEP